MATLNRFPLFGLWNRVAAEVLEYEPDEARCIGHGVAVLYAIRAQGGGYRKPKKGGADKGSIPVGKDAKVLAADEIAFGGDSLPCELDADGRVLRCLVGCRSPRDKAQTPSSYEHDVEAKIKGEYLELLTNGMRELLSSYKPAELGGRLIYRRYDDFKRACAAGRRIDLDALVEWLKEETRKRARTAA